MSEQHSWNLSSNVCAFSLMTEIILHSYILIYFYIPRQLLYLCFIFTKLEYPHSQSLGVWNVQQLHVFRWNIDPKIIRLFFFFNHSLLFTKAYYFQKLEGYIFQLGKKWQMNFKSSLCSIFHALLFIWSVRFCFILPLRLNVLIAPQQVFWHWLKKKVLEKRQTISD